MSDCYTQDEVFAPYSFKVSEATKSIKKNFRELSLLVLTFSSFAAMPLFYPGNTVVAVTAIVAAVAVLVTLAVLFKGMKRDVKAEIDRRAVSSYNYLAGQVGEWSYESDVHATLDNFTGGDLESLVTGHRKSVAPSEEAQKMLWILNSIDREKMKDGQKVEIQIAEAQRTRLDLDLIPDAKKVEETLYAYNDSYNEDFSRHGYGQIAWRNAGLRREFPEAVITDGHLAVIMHVSKDEIGFSAKVSGMTKNSWYRPGRSRRRLFT